VLLIILKQTYEETGLGFPLFTFCQNEREPTQALRLFHFIRSFPVFKGAIGAAGDSLCGWSSKARQRLECQSLSIVGVE
jgi:hypothetical protein